MWVIQFLIEKFFIIETRLGIMQQHMRENRIRLFPTKTILQEFSFVALIYNTKIHSTLINDPIPIKYLHKHKQLS